MKVVYTSKSYLSHALTADQQRERYDSQARHERYIRDRDAGKTGYQGLQGRNNSSSYATKSNSQSSSRVIAQRTSPSRPLYRSRRPVISRQNPRQRPMTQAEPMNPQERTIYQIRQQINSLQNGNVLNVKQNKEAIKKNLAVISKNIQRNIDRVQAILDSRKRSK